MIKLLTALLACAGKEEPAYLLMISTTFRRVSMISFFTDDRTDDEGLATVCDAEGLDEVARDTKKFRSIDICWSMWLTAY